MTPAVIDGPSLKPFDLAANVGPQGGALCRRQSTRLRAVVFERDGAETIAATGGYHQRRCLRLACQFVVVTAAQGDLRAVLLFRRR
jgi:hypothetical protein